MVEERVHAHERIADHGGAEVAGVHLLGHVRRRVVDDDGLRRAAAATPSRSSAATAASCSARNVGENVTLTKPGTGDLEVGRDTGEHTRIDDLLGHLTWVDTEALGQREGAVDLGVGTIGHPHGRVGGIAAVQTGEDRFQQVVIVAMGSDMGTPFFPKSSPDPTDHLRNADHGLGRARQGVGSGGALGWVRARRSGSCRTRFRSCGRWCWMRRTRAPSASSTAWLLGYEYRPGDEPPPSAPDPHGDDWLVLRDRSGTARLAIQHVDELPAATWPEPVVPQQLHLDMTVADVDELARQHDRALALGGDRTRGPVSATPRNRSTCWPTLPATRSASSSSPDHP